MATKKILVVYFSHSGNTREVANQIQKNTGGDIFEIQPVKQYPEDYDEAVKQATAEIKINYRPELKTKVEDIKSYDIIFVGSPCWWSTIATPVKTFLSEYDLSGKTIVPFMTHEGSGLGKSVSDISKMCSKSNVLEGLAVRGGSVKNSQNKIIEWLSKIKI